MILLIVALFFSDGTQRALVTEARSAEACESVGAEMTPGLVGLASGNALVTGAAYRCVSIPRVDNP